MPVKNITDKEMKAICQKALDKEGNIQRAARKAGYSRPYFRKCAIRYGLWPRKKMKEAA